MRPMRVGRGQVSDTDDGKVMRRSETSCVAWASLVLSGRSDPAPLLRLDRNVLRLAGRLL